MRGLPSLTGSSLSDGLCGFHRFIFIFTFFRFPRMQSGGEGRNCNPAAQSTPTTSSTPHSFTSSTSGITTITTFSLSLSNAPTARSDQPAPAALGTSPCHPPLRARVALDHVISTRTSTSLRVQMEATELRRLLPKPLTWKRGLSNLRVTL